MHSSKKRGIRIGVLSIAVSVMFLAAASGTKAETQDGHRKGLVAELHIVSASLPGPRSDSVDGKELSSISAPGFLIALKEGLNVFIDSPSPFQRDGLAPVDAPAQYRAVIGFHIPL